MERSVQTMRDYGLKGLLWVFEPELFDGNHASLANYKEMIGKAQRGQ